MQVEPKSVDLVEVDGTPIPVRGPSCLKCPRMVVCKIYENTATFLNEKYPLLKDQSGKLLPDEKQIRPYAPEQLATICKHYAGIDRLSTATK